MIRIPSEPAAARPPGPLHALRPAAAVAAAAVALSGCALFGRGDDEPKRVAPEEGRISILALEQQLEADPELAGRAPSVPEAAPLPAWTQPGGVVTNAPGNIAGDGALEIAWRRDIAEGSDRRDRLSAPPVIADGRLFVLSADQELRAVDLASGRGLWRADLRPRERRGDRHAIGGGVAYADGRVYAVSGFGVAAAFDPATGAEVWRAVGVAPFSGAPTVADGRLYAVTNDSELFAIDAASGQVLWTHQAIAEPARILAAPSPAASAEFVIAPFASGEVIALLPANGRRLWVDGLSRAGRPTSLASINDVAGRPVLIDGLIYAVSHSGVLAAIDGRSGQRLWARAFGSTQTPLVVGDTLYAVSIEGELAAFDRMTGRVFWIAPLARYRDPGDRKGRIAWTGPLMIDGKLLLASSHGRVAIVSPADGAIEREIRLGEPVFVPPVAAEGVVYILDDTGRLTALR